MIHLTDYVLLSETGWFLHKNNKTSTDNIKNARTYKTYQGACRRCEGTNYKYIRADEYKVFQCSICLEDTYKTPGSLVDEKHIVCNGCEDNRQ